VIGCFDTIHAVCYGAWIPEIVTPEKILATNKWLEGSDAAVTLVAPLFAAIAILLDPLIAVAVNAASFAVAAAILLAGTKSKLTYSNAIQASNKRSAFGLKLLVRKDIRRLLGSYFPLYANSGAALLLFIALSQEKLPDREGLASLLVSAAGIGGLVCAFVFDRAANHWRSGTVLLVASCTLMGVYLLAAISRGFVALLCLVAIMDFAVSAGYVVVGSIRHLSFGAHERSSISGLIVSMNALVLTASASLVGLASKYLGIEGALMLMALTTIPLMTCCYRLPQSHVQVGQLGHEDALA
jgi:predicted MFS family arabinose efflux permease